MEFCISYLGGMFTANTMSSAVETLGMSLPGQSAWFVLCFKKAVVTYGLFGAQFHFISCIGSASGPAVDSNNVITAKKKQECAQIVDAVFQLLEKRITAKQILTKKVARLIF